MRVKKLPLQNDINVTRNNGDSQMSLWNGEDCDEALAVTRTMMTRVNCLVGSFCPHGKRVSCGSVADVLCIP